VDVSNKVQRSRTGGGRRQAGFTLVELTVAVAVVGILAATSYGSYTQHVMRANRSAVQQFMLDVVSRQELYVLDARTYAAEIGDAGLGIQIPERVADYYAVAITLTAGPPPGYVVTAVPGGHQATDGVLTLTSTGEKTPAEKWER
jgi:type IV pilus assembly protein PilE